MQKGGFRIIERSKLQEVLNEQSIRLTSSTDDEADILRVGKMLGTDGVVFADANITQAEGYYSPAAYHVSVTVRYVRVETGEIRWAGSAITRSIPVINPERALTNYAIVALAHAMCETERGYTWIEPGSGRIGGCKKPQ